ncbi:hypothetical protein DENSPDRAFT_780612 [Dentipellis sp. KUC8613]|nr:hypothetical protein DENSPDRAFT_780612 [Dentipellis sp. KUC8613]
MDRLGIPQVAISPYNSKANGVVERGHFIIREAIVKSCEHQMQKWPGKVQEAFFADKVTTSQVTGFSPYYLLHGVHPVLPFDLTEATFLVEGFKSGMSHAELLALRIRQLEKRAEDLENASYKLIQYQIHSKEEFERKFKSRLSQKEFQSGELVLVRNSMVEKSLNRKTKPRYRGPYEVVRRTKGGSYILQELSGVVMRDAVAAFRLIPYIARNEAVLKRLAEEVFEESSDEESGSDDREDTD